AVCRSLAHPSKCRLQSRCMAPSFTSTTSPVKPAHLPPSSSIRSAGSSIDQSPIDPPSASPHPPPMNADDIRTQLAAPLTLPNGQTLENRIAKSAMSETLGPPDNRVPATIPTLYGRWARGGLGLQITGNVMIDRRAIGEPGNVAVEDARDMERLREWARQGQQGGTRIYMQL